MDFLVKHYEKLILGLSLLCLILCVLLVRKSFIANSAKIEEKEKNAQQITKNLRKNLEEIDSSAFQGRECLVNPCRLVAVESPNTKKGMDKKGGLVTPKRYVVCRNEQCKYLIAFNSDRCPFCRTQQDPIGKDITEEDDTDGDGIPDLYEQKFPDILDFLDPDDGRMDADNDCFLNVEEYRAGTSPDNPDDHPKLAALLRVAWTGKRPLPCRFENLRKVDSDNPADWRVVLQVGKSQETVKIGDDIGKTGFKVESAASDGNSIVVTSNDGKSYTLPKRKEVTEDIDSARMYYLNFRERAMLRRNPVVFKRLNETFVLRTPTLGENANNGDRNARGAIQETYRILAIEDEPAPSDQPDAKPTKLVRVGLLDAEDESRHTQEFVIRVLDPKNDFLYIESNADAMRNMDGGGAAMPMRNMGGGRRR
ncbi:MAG: hypothetical protein J6866_07165 [Victivallales bacterium]|nr:hypothetical protein [Victivallales bacterium]